MSLEIHEAFQMDVEYDTGKSYRNKHNGEGPDKDRIFKEGDDQIILWKL